MSHVTVFQSGARDWTVYRAGRYLGTITRFDGGIPAYGAGARCYTTSRDRHGVSHETLDEAIAVFEAA